MVINLRLMIYFKVAEKEFEKIDLFRKIGGLRLFCIKLSDDRILSPIIQLQLLDKK